MTESMERPVSETCAEIDNYHKFHFLFPQIEVTTGNAISHQPERDRSAPDHARPVVTEYFFQLRHPANASTDSEWVGFLSFA
jgi:hypothetical protein